MASGLAVTLMSLVPVPLALVRGVLRADNDHENRLDLWGRLRGAGEVARYAAVRGMVERYAGDGFVLDVGCSQGILQEGLRYARYLGIDSYPAAIAYASSKADDRTSFLVADGSTFVPDRPADAVVLNEVVYYLPDPAGTVHHYADQLNENGVVIVSIYARTWSSRQLLRRLVRELDMVERTTATSGRLAWAVVALRARR